MTIIDVSSPARGIAETFADGIRYLPREPGPYVDQFTYVVEDDVGATATALVTVHVLQQDPNIVVEADARVTAAPSGLTTLRLTARNQSVVDIFDVELRIELDRELVLTDSSHPIQFEPDRGEWSVRFATLEPAATEEVWITVRVGAETIGSLPFSVRLEAASADVNPDDNDADGVVEILPGYCFIPQLGALVARWRGDASAAGGGFSDDGGSFPLFAEQVSLVPGFIGDAFDTTSAAFELFAQDARLSPPAFTVGAWVRSDAPPNGLAPVLFSAGRFWLGVQNGHPAFTVFNIGDGFDLGTNSVVDTEAFPIGRWVHLGASFDAGTARLYVDGIEVASLAIAEPMTDLGLDVFQIGSAALDRFAPDAISRFAGLIDDVVLYDVELQPDDVSRLVTGAPNVCGIPTTTEIGLTLQPDPNPALVDSLVEFRIEVSNLSDGRVENVVVEHDLPLLSRFFDASPAPTSSSDDQVRFEVGPLLGGETLEVVVRAFAPHVDGPFETSASVEADGELANADATLIVWPVDCENALPDECIVNAWPTLVSPGPQAHRVGDVVAVDVIASDPDAGDVLSFTATNLPPGLAIHPATGRISGTMLAAGGSRYEVTLTVSDGRLWDTLHIDWSVMATLTLNVNVGGVIRVGLEVCDASGGATTCSFEFAADQVVPLSVLETPSGTVAPRYRADGQELASLILMNRDWVVDVDFLGEFTLRVEGAADWPEARLVFLLSEGTACARFLSESECVGHAVVGSTVILSHTNTAQSIFVEWGGICAGAECSFVMDSVGLAVTARYRAPTADLSLEFPPDFEPLFYGYAAGDGDFEFPVQVSNLGPDAASDIDVVFGLNGSLDDPVVGLIGIFADLDLSDGLTTCAHGGSIDAWQVCHIPGPVLPGNSTSIRFVLRVPEPPVEATVEFSGLVGFGSAATTDPDHGNDDAQSRASLEWQAPASLGIGAEAVAIVRNVGGSGVPEITYEISVTNHGPSHAPDVRVTTPTTLSRLAPAELIDAVGADCEIIGGGLPGLEHLSCVVGDVASGDTAVFQVTLRPFAELAVTGTVGMRFTASSVAADLDQADNTTTLQVTFNEPPVCSDIDLVVGEDGILVARMPCADPDGDAIEIEIISLDLTGIEPLTIDGSGQDWDLTVVPEPDFSGDGGSFTFRATDGHLASAVMVASIAVTPVNDAPVALSAPPGGRFNVFEDDFRPGTM